MLVVYVVLVLLLLLVVYDTTQKKNAIWHNFPIIGHFRNLIIEIGPELRQYIVAHNREEQPFNRLEREWIYSSARHENNYFGFGTDDQIYSIGYPVIKHAVFPYGEKGFTGSKTTTTRTSRVQKSLGLPTTGKNRTDLLPSSTSRP